MDSATVRKSYYETPGGEVHYRYLYAATKDESKIPIMFLHMTAISGRCYEPLMKRCAAAGYDCYAPDMPGFGNSYDPVEDPSSIAFYVETFLALAKAESISKLHLVGHHTGASIGTEWAALYPEMVASLTMSGPALCTEEEQASFRANDMVEFNKPVADGSHLTLTWGHAYKMGKWEDPVAMHPYCLEALRAYHGRIQAYSCVFTHDLMKSMGLVKCPILDLTSDTDMLKSYASRLKEIKPDAVFGTVGGGDWEPLKDVGNFSAELLKFLP